MSATAKQKRKNFKSIQPKMKLFRAKEPLLSVFMWGINHSINELANYPGKVMLMPDDFKAYSKIKVDNHNFNKENMPSHFKFKEYCPHVFRNLRERFEVEDDVYLGSLSKECPHESDSSGRSGARFLVSWDKKFVIKTILTEEVAEMHRILEGYHQHIVERHADTLLPQYMGMYRLTVNDQETYILVMRNIFSPRLGVHKKYDLKGSTVDRQASDKEKAKDLPTFKDVDFKNDQMSIQIGKDQKEKLMATLNADVNFLSNLNLMDYSFLLGIHDRDRAEEELNESLENEENGCEEEEVPEGAVPMERGDRPVLMSSQSGATPPDSPQFGNMPDFCGEMDPELEFFGFKCSEACPKNEIYFMALIDILTHYGMKKRTAQAAKAVKHGANAEISTVKPDQYAKRFLEFIEKALE